MQAVVEFEKKEKEKANVEITKFVDQFASAKSEKKMDNVMKILDEMHTSKYKKNMREEGLAKKAKEIHEELTGAMPEEKVAPYVERLHKVMAKRSPKRKLVLASAPELGIHEQDGWPLLRIAAHALELIDGASVAGWATDTFHLKLMEDWEVREQIPGWRTGWKGKVDAVRILSLPKNDKDAELVLLSLKGGPETDWERNYLENNFSKVSDDQRISIVKFETLEELLEWTIQQTS